MNDVRLANRSLGNSPSLTDVSAEELMLVHGGSIFSWLKGAATWAYDHVLVDFAHFVFGYKGTF